jgi:hypothetical protein
MIRKREPQPIYKSFTFETDVEHKGDYPTPEGARTIEDAAKHLVLAAQAISNVTVNGDMDNTTFYKLMSTFVYNIDRVVVYNCIEPEISRDSVIAMIDEIAYMVR